VGSIGFDGAGNVCTSGSGPPWLSRTARHSRFSCEPERHRFKSYISCVVSARHFHQRNRRIRSHSPPGNQRISLCSQREHACHGHPLLPNAYGGALTGRVSPGVVTSIYGSASVPRSAPSHKRHVGQSWFSRLSRLYRTAGVRDSKSRWHAQLPGKPSQEWLLNYVSRHGWDANFSPLVDGQVATSAFNLCPGRCEITSSSWATPSNAAVLYGGFAPSMVAGVAQFNVSLGTSDEQITSLSAFTIENTLAQSVWVAPP
jgi:hypothetical protein